MDILFRGGDSVGLKENLFEITHEKLLKYYGRHSKVNTVYPSLGRWIC